MESLWKLLEHQLDKGSCPGPSKPTTISPVEAVFEPP